MLVLASRGVGCTSCHARPKSRMAIGWGVLIAIHGRSRLTVYPRIPRIYNAGTENVELFHGGHGGLK